MSVAPRKVVLTARWHEGAPVPGTLLAAPKGQIVFRVEAVTTIREAGKRLPHLFRVTCERLRAAELPPGSKVHPWRWNPSGPPRRRRTGLVGKTADPGPPEPHAAKLARMRAKAPLLVEMALTAIRKGRIADEVAQLARVARVGRDDGVRENRDLGPGIRLEKVRARRGGGVLREADVEIEDGPDPDRPKYNVRRARRCDPLTALWRAGTISGRDLDACELLRQQLQAAQPSIPSAGNVSVHLPPDQRIGMTDWQINNCGWARRALEAVSPTDQPVLLWVLIGGSIVGYANYARTRQSSSATALKSAMSDLADHYFGRRSNDTYRHQERGR